MRFEYDSRFQCWALRRYADVLAALKDSQRFAYTPWQQFDETAQTRSLRASMDRFPPPVLAATLPSQAICELVSEWIEPWCHAAALQLVTLTTDPGGRLLDLARKAFEAGARLDASADAETQHLAAMLPPALGPITVQAFVATSQTLAAFLANAAAALLESGTIYPHTPKALEELMRFAGPSQAQYRFLTESTGELPKGTRIALLLAEANRDPQQFPDPDQLDFERNATGHLAFGYGLHACLGAVLIRASAPVALRQLTPLLQSADLVSIEWPLDPRNIRSPRAIRIRELGPGKVRYQE